jgi:segregation and condensation protein A
MNDQLTADQIFELDNFRGPLDLLLHLVREQEVEITEVDLSRLCDQYLAALDTLRGLDINVAGEFLVVASTLVLIKSRAILPREEVNLEEELDPGDELILQLLEYRRYKTLSLALQRRAEERALRHARGASDVPPAEEPELAEVSMWDLVGSYARLVEELGLKRGFDTLKQEKPLKAYLRDVLDNLLARPEWTFRDLLLASGGPEGVFGVFLSVLELVKSRQVRVSQEETGGEIRIALREDRDDSVLSGLFTDTAAPKTAVVEGEEPPEAGAPPSADATPPADAPGPSRDG